MDWCHQDILVEVLKHLDAKSLAMAGCVNKKWKRVSLMESVWEGVCTKHWPLTHPRSHSVVVALGGYRRLYLLCLRPILSSSSSFHCCRTRTWTKDEVQLSLSLFSIICYERMAKLSDSASSLMFLYKPNSQNVHFSPIYKQYFD